MACRWIAAGLLVAGAGGSAATASAHGFLIPPGAPPLGATLASQLRRADDFGPYRTGGGAATVFRVVEDEPGEIALPVNCSRVLWRGSLRGVLVSPAIDAALPLVAGMPLPPVPGACTLVFTPEPDWAGEVRVGRGGVGEGGGGGRTSGSWQAAVWALTGGATCARRRRYMRLQAAPRGRSQAALHAITGGTSRSLTGGTVG
jgi:hypothetical protein